MKLEDIFHVKNGIASSGLNILAKRVPDSVAFIRPASTQQRTVAGWVIKSSVKKTNVFPEGSLFVSTNGEGSHSYSYISSFEFIPNSDVAVLIPKFEMTIQEKVFYARCITMNRYRFSYGRKPKGNRLKKIELPDAIPEWVNKVDTNLYNGLENPASNKTLLTTDNLFSNLNYDLVQLDEVFDVKYGVNLELNRMKIDPNGINFISRTAKNNGVSAKVALLDDVEPIKARVITVAGGGSVLESFLQKEPFYSGRDLYYLTPKVEMSDAQMLFYCVCIRSNQYRYSYGRQANRTLKKLRIPAPTKHLLDNVDNYINSLPYSSQI